MDDSMGKNQHVTPHPNGGWQAKEQEAENYKISPKLPPLPTPYKFFVLV